MVLLVIAETDWAKTVHVLSREHELGQQSVYKVDNASCGLGILRLELYLCVT